MYYGITRTNDYICHHGVKGQRWGVRHDKPRTSLSFSQKRILRKQGYQRTYKKNVGKVWTYDQNNPHKSDKRAWAVEDTAGIVSIGKPGESKRQVKKNYKVFHNKIVNSHLISDLMNTRSEDPKVKSRVSRITIKDINQYYKKNPNSRKAINDVISNMSSQEKLPKRPMPNSQTSNLMMPKKRRISSKIAKGAAFVMALGIIAGR